MWSLLACDVLVTGAVHEPGGGPIAGAAVADGACNAVTGPEGQFATRCPRSTYHFVVTHPTHAAGELAVNAEGLQSPPPASVKLVPWPSAPGLYTLPDYAALPSPGLVRRATKTTSALCLPENTALPVVLAELTLFDLHDTDWRLYALDAEGCGLAETLAAGTRYWSPEFTPIEPVSAPRALAPGRFHVHESLKPGRYAAVPWLAGGPVPTSDTTYAAWAFEVR